MAASRLDKLGPDLSAYLDGELPEQRAREIERLLASSPECRQALEQLREASDRLATLPRRRAPDELTAAMRRYAERRDLLDQARPTGGGRVLRLFVRLTAAAAVLIGCVFVGWQVVDRSRPQPGREIAADHVSRDAETEEGVPIAARGPQPSVYDVEEGLTQAHSPAADIDGDAISELTLLDESTDAPVVALAEPSVPGVATLAFEAESTESVATGVAVAQPESTAAPSPVRPDEGYKIAQAGAADDLSDGPIVDVWVTPQSTEQFAAAYTFLVARSAGQRQEYGIVNGLFQSDQTGPGWPPPQGVQVVHYIPAAEFAALITDLERQVPEQVYFEMKLRASDMNLLQALGRAPAEPDAKSVDDEDVSGAREPAAGEPTPDERNAVVRSGGSRGRHSGAASAERRDAERRVRDGRPAEETVARARGAQELSPATPARPKGPRGGRGRQTPEDKRLERSRVGVGGAPVGAPDEQPAPRTSQPAGRIRRVASPAGAKKEVPATQPATAGQTRARRLGARVREIIRGTATQWSRVAGKHARQSPEAITVRVSLLPPPTPTSRTATQPAPSPTSQPPVEP